MATRLIDNGRNTDFSLEYVAGPGGGDMQITAIVEHKEAAVVLTGGIAVYAVTSSAAVSLDPPTAAYDYARLRVRRTSGTAADDSRKVLFYTEDGVTPQSDGDPANGFLVHLDVFYVKLADATNFKMIAEPSETFTVHCEWLKRA